MNVSDIFYSFHIDELPKLRHLKELLYADSVVPADLDPAVLPIHEERHVLGRRKLDQKPDFAESLEEEKALYQEKLGDKEVPIQGRPYMIRRTYVRRLDQRTRLEKFKSEVKAAYGGQAQLTGDFIYYPGSYREWHTNLFDPPGWRMYMVDVAEEGRSGFRYVAPDTGEIVDVLDRRGKVNFFHLNPERPLLHCVHSQTLRWSKGFLIPGDWRETLFR